MVKEGLYDLPIDRALDRRLSSLPSERVTTSQLDPNAAPEQLARIVHERLRRALEGVQGKPEERRARQVDLVNRVLERLQEEASQVVVADHQIAERAERLLQVRPPLPSTLGEGEVVPRPRIGLATSDLLVNAPHDLRIGAELRRELGSADRVDLICAFLKWSGLRVLDKELRAFLDRRPGGLRVLTTAYMAATERRALDELSRLGAQVRVSYDTTQTRLHAKAWLFHRETGFSTCFVGSSNLSAAALVDGHEWNVRLSRVDNFAILERFSACFEHYWSESNFEPYSHERDAERFDTAVRTQRTDRHRLITAIDVSPRAHQVELLDALAAERAAGHNRNLVVAATGTGKTIVAALDYKRLRKQLGKASLLFVAHRKEILEQSLTAFQVVLKDSGFGEMLGGGETPRAGEHVFASVQSLSEDRLAALPADAYDVVIVDEFHHAAAPTYRRLLDHLKPRFLLGLTATPERTDGVSVLHWFDHRIAAELRLWKALDQSLLSPFQYFGLSGPDLQGVRWSRGRYDVAELRNVYTADDVFVRRVLQELSAKVSDPMKMRALGFCVDVRHAEFMAQRFNLAGINSAAVHGGTPTEARRAALTDLRQGRLQALFSVDLFNEGVDVPDVDTIIFLRPTESATLFLQQLGRGLRLSEGKSCCTVLDFIGGANRKFRFDQRFRALIGGSRKGIRRAIEEGFPQLPAGCDIRLDRVARTAVLDNLREALGSRAALVDELSAIGDVPLEAFLEEAGLELEDVYDRPGASYTELRRRAGFAVEAFNETQQSMERALARVLHVDDPLRLIGFMGLLDHDEPPLPDDTDPRQRLLFILLGQARAPYSDLEKVWTALWRAPSLRRELQSILRLVKDRGRNLTFPVDLPLGDHPLHVHASYRLDEVMGAVDERTKKGGVKRIQTGVYFVSALQTDLFFVTLEKQEKDYSPTTLYQDYPISDRRFHWESQSSCHDATPTGRRYTEILPGGERNALMFVRPRRHDDRGIALPYRLLGQVWYVRHEGGRPMKIEWALQTPIPAATYQDIKVAAG